MAMAMDNQQRPNRPAFSGERKASDEALAEIWAEVLRRPHLEKNANFFDIGGDSLKAMEVITRVREVLHVDMPLIAFFEDPTLAHLAAVVDELKEAESPPIVRDPGRSEFPLSYSQQMFWLLEQQNPGTGIYNTARIFRMRGKVDSAVLESSLNELRRWHEILRVRFIHRENGPVQNVEDPTPLPLALTDLSGLEPSAREKTALKLAHEVIAEPFDLTSGPLLRARLVRLDPEEHLLCMAIHHAVSDGFTGGILLNELAAIYDALVAGQPNPLSEPDLHFTDYAAWEQEWMSGSLLEQELEYWRSALQDAPTSLDLPTDRADSSESRHRGSAASETISADSLRNIQGLAQSNGATLFTVLAAGLRILLYRWSGQSDFLLGTIASNRSHWSAERMIGCFVNPLPLRNRVTDHQSTSDLLNNEKNVVMDAFAHQDCPFAKIVEAVNPERTSAQPISSDNPLFNVALLLQNFPDISVRGSWFEAQQVDFDAQVALLDLRFIASETSAGLQLDCEYNVDLFRERTIERLLDDYVSVLMQMAAAPETRVEHIAISEDLLKLRDEHLRARNKQTIAIAATFTAGPVEEPLSFWMEKLRIASRIEFAPYSQVFQQLLNPASLLARNTGFNVILVRLEDWRNPQGAIEDRIDELVAGLKVAASRGDRPYVVAVFPPLNSAAAQVESYARMEAVLASELGELAGAHLITAAEVLELYPVEAPEDAYALKLGHIPYTPAFFTAIASALARRIYNLCSTPRKVIALGCDQTLWKGFCEKDGPLDVVVDAPHRALQQFMIDQFEAGRILCLCSRNEEEHVAAAFEGNPGMLLTRDHILLNRINRRSKSENLKELAQDLQLGLNSFIFVDGDPQECAEVRACCPQVTVVELPAGPGILQHLRHCWAFDRSENMAGSQKSTAQARDSGLLNQIASELCTVEKIAYAIESQKSSRSAKPGGDVRLRTSTEDIVAAIWAGVLGVDPGVDDNFFELGGNSLRAAQVIARIRQALGVEIPLRALFESPTIVMFAARVEAAVRALAGLTAPPLVPLPRAGHPPVSFAQQRLWFIEELEPGNSLYNISQAIRIRGNLDVAALEQSINEVVNRHEALRTSFEAVDGQPLQVIAPTLKLALPITDLSLAPNENREEEILRIAREEAIRPFDLKRGPLLRASLLRLLSEEHILLLTIHHIVSDGWSLGVMAKELGALYGAFSGTKFVDLPRLPVQYADFSMWQRDWLRGEVLEKQAGYWRQQLSGAPAILELPSDRPRAPQSTHRGAILSSLLPHALVENLTALSHSEGATLFMTLLAAFQALLFRYSGQEDIVVGSPVAGRNCAEIEPLIGFFVNSLPLRTNLSGDPTFRELLKRVKEVTLNAYAHQDIPFERLVEELKIERSLSYNPIFQVVFALQNAPTQALALPGLTLERIPMHPGTALFDLSWFAVPVAEGLRIRVEYSSELFDESTIARGLGHFQELLASAAENPASRLSELPILTAAERHQLVAQWNDTATPYPAETCVPVLFERQSASAPEQIAVAFEKRRMTYGSLNRRANQIAHYLQEQGVGPNVCVGLALPRSADMITGLLGILKAGGAYLPLDVEHPKERLAYIIRDAEIPIILTEKDWLDLLPEDVSTVCLDRDAREIDRQPAEDLPQLTRSSDLAYVIYTSGSTGHPKGVEIDHRGLMNLVIWHQREYCVQPDDRATQVASPAFDASVWEIWPYLTAGASLHIPDEVTRSSPEKLVDWLARQAISLTFLPTPLAEAVLDHLKTSGAQGLKLRALLTGGDKLHAGADPALPFAVVNHYGPTENTVVSTWARVACGPQSAPPIGKPIANTRVYVLDRRMKPVPIGVPGELYIGGDSLARGYRNRPELTAERFVCDPFHAGSRLFRSGDRVRYLPSGDLEFMGRLDDQVKLRGYRIEPREIETALSKHSAVKECVALALDDMPGGKQVVAYVVSREPGALPETDFRRLLQSQLPEYMVPSVFVSLDALPLMPNGKVDRKALPTPKITNEKQTYVGPRTPIEEIIAATWMEILGLHRVGIHDNFFELGGHSLLATRVASRLCVSIRIDVPLRWLFESPTIAELASRIDGMGRSSNLPPLRRRDASKEAPLSFAQERLWFLDQLEPNHPWYNSPFAIRMEGDLRVEALERALNEIVSRHEVLRTTFRVENFHPVQVVTPELRIQIPIVDLSRLSVEQQKAAAKRMALEAAQRTFNLQTGPVFRANLLQLAGRDHILLLNFHHIAIDGWSLWRFIQELAVLYEAFVEGRPSPLPELPIQYADYAVWHRDWIKDDVLASLLAYWKKQLAGAPATLGLPTDRVRPALLSYKGATARISFSPQLADELNSLSRRENATLFMTMFAAFQTLLFRYSGQEDIVVGTSIANRTHLGVENLIGFFVNALVMRTDLSGNPTFRELLRRVRTTAIEAYAHQDLPFEKLVEALQPDRDLGQTPLFQVCFVLQNAPRTSFHLPGLGLSAMDVHNETTKFDLSLFVVEKPDGLICTAEYSTDLFDADTIQRLLGHYRVLLESVVDNPDERIAALPLLTAEEERVLLSEWNDTSKQFPRETCLSELFERQVERTPDNIALLFENQRLTYSELNQRANQLAHRLQALGVGPEILVGICVERSLEMLIGILGILKAGGAYLPLDPTYPQGRLAFMLEDAQVPVLLTQAGLMPGLPAHQAIPICLDTDWPSIALEPTENPSRRTHSQNVAYVIYTSGSTGKPKGCIVTHANVARLFTATHHWFDFGPDDTWTLFHSIAFDFSVWEIWGALLYGGRLVVVPRLTSRSPEQFHELLIQHRVTVLNQTPSAFRQLIVADERSGCSDRLALRYVIFGGEALEFKTLLPWIERHENQPALINMYGITETTVHVTYFKVDVSAIGENTVSWIGRPIPDLQVYVLDSQRRPVPIGVTGEMYVGGHGVARGYLNRPELTAERFIADPFRSDPASRLYKTGDLARFRPDGNLQYLGRIDHQVKIRGFRVELGEIEVALESHPGVRQSVVIAREDQTGDKRLVAYLVPNSDYSGSDRAEPEEAIAIEQVSRWTEAFDEAYRQSAGAAEATFNIAGWDSSYTGEPIDSVEMRTWVETTVARIRTLSVQRVWEIGCGTGLLLFRLAPHSERYYGTDVSQTALDFLQSQLRRPDLRLPHLTLERRVAHEFDKERRAAQFTTVVLNSVIQYFPDLDYFIKVLDGAMESVAPGGAIFIGDVRSFPLLEAFHTSVQLYKAPDSMTCSQFRQRVQASMRQEGELLIDPEFFLALPRRHPAISRVEIQLKRGRAHNELTLFRYDVILHIGNSPVPLEDCAWLDWKKEGLTLAGLREILQQASPEILALTNVPNARLSADCAALRMLSSDDGPPTVGELRAGLQDVVEPEDLWSIEDELPYRVEIRFSSVPAEGCCDVLFQRTKASDVTRNVARFHGKTDVVRPLETYANNPLRQRVAGKLIPQVRAWLDGKLPDYMRPSAYALLDSLPLTANGKVNRRALPAPDEIRPEGQSDYVAPRGPVEELVAAVFADVLRIDRAGAGDDFFDLGGHSLSATQVVSRIRQAFQMELPVRALFESSTVAGLANVVEQIQRGSRGLVPPPIGPASRNQPLPLSLAQQRLWILDQAEPNNPLYNVPRAIRMIGNLNVDALAKALKGIVDRHEVLRTTYCAEFDEPIQVIAPELQIALPILDLSSLAAVERQKESRRIIQEECCKAFDLAKDPMLRSLLLKLDVQEHILFLNTHHIANDGWSNGVFMRDFAALYSAALNGKPAVLPELVIQYADYAVWQRNWLQGEVLEKQLAYWKACLQGAPPILELPTDHPRPPVQTFQGASHVATLPASLMDAVRALSRQHETTTFMTLLAAFYALVMYYSKQTDIVLGTDVAGRNDVRTEALIGFFVNLLVLRTDLSGDPTVAELLGRVRETALGAYTHQDAPFDRVVEELRPERSLGHNPLVQILFVQMTRAHTQVQIPGLQMSDVPLELPSKFDLVVLVAESTPHASVKWVYSCDLFNAATIERMAFLYQIAIEKITAEGDMRLSQIMRSLAEADQRRRATENRQFQEMSLQRLKQIKQRAATRI